MLMKKLLKSLVLILFACLVSTCGSDKQAKDTGTTTAEPSEEAVIEAEEAPAVSVYWGNLGLREEPKKDGKWITSIKLGEKVTSLGITATDTANKMEYIKVRLMDGKEGWTQANLIVPNAQPAVLIREADIYSRPDLVTKSNKQYSKMDIIAVMQSQDEWIEVKGKRAEGKWVETGWIKPINISYEETDIAVAIFTNQALNEETDQAKIEALEEIIQNSDLSHSELIPEVVSILNELKEETVEPEEPTE